MLMCCASCPGKLWKNGCHCPDRRRIRVAASRAELPSLVLHFLPRDPNQPLHFSTQELPKREFARMATRLASEQVQLLAEICAVPRPASEVVTEFHLRTRHVYPDRNVVLTLQDLVTAGVLLPTRYRKNEYKEEFA